MDGASNIKKDQLKTTVEKGLALKAFSNNNLSFYIYKRTERIVAAVFMVTDLMDSSGHIRHEVRGISTALLKDTLVFLTDGEEPGNVFIRRACVSIFHMRSLLEIAFLAGDISEMNFAVLSRAFGDLVSSLERTLSDLAAPVARGEALFPERFFEVESRGLEAEGVSLRSRLEALDALKEPRVERPVPRRAPAPPASLGSAPAPVAPRGAPSGAETHSSRRSVILRILQESSTPLTIKDIARHVSGFSEKTVQRELLSLVEEGRIEKQGARRWTTYALPSKRPLK